jgi:NitT/TauT family transport system substrate-binding protein
MVAAAGVALLFAGCAASPAAPSSGTASSGPAGPATPLNFQLNFYPGGSMAGYSVAKANNYYKDAGLDVTLVPGNGAANTAQLVASGQAKLGAADGTTVSQLISKGAPIVVIATIYQSNANSVQALTKSGIKSAKDLVGKKVGVPSGSSQTTMLPLFFKANDVDASKVSLVNMPPTSMVQTLLQGKVDAILGSTDSYGIQLDQQGAKHTDIPFATHGVPTVGTSIIANTEYLKSNGDTAKKFVAASLKGWRDFSKDPDKAVDDVVKQFSSAQAPQVKAESEAILDNHLLCAGGAKYVGKAEPDQWTKLQNLLAEVKLLPEGTDPTKYYTYDYLPPRRRCRAARSNDHVAGRFASELAYRPALEETS